MNKTLNINLGGLIFHIDEDAFHKLERYLSILKKQFAGAQGSNEIINDIEVRIAELFKERTSEAKEVISGTDVDEVIGIMGKPEDYLDPEDDLNSAYGSKSYRRRSSKRFFRDPDDKILGGVASGLAAYLNVEAIWIRIALVLLTLSGFSIIFYIILWAVIPKARTTAEKLQMRGESVNVSNIERSVKEEFRDLGENVKDFGRKAGEYDYKKPANQLGEFISDVAGFFLNALKFIIKFFFKLIGLAFLAMAFVALLAVIAAFFSGSFNIIHGGYTINDLYDFMQLLTANTAHFNLLMIGVFLLLLAPVVMIIYLGVRMLFKLEPLSRTARSGLTGVAIIGFIMVLISGIRIGLEFDDRSNYTKYHVLESPNEKLYLQVNSDEVYEALKDRDFNKKWMQYSEGNIFTNVELDIRESDDGTVKIKRHIRSEGNTRRAARNNAENVEYSFSMKNDSLLSFNSYYVLPYGQKWRDQEVELTLYLPVGTSVYLEDNMVDIIYDIQNIDDYWDFDMVNHEWIMTKDGLKCADCPNSDSDYFGDEEAEDEWEDEYEEVVPEDQDEIEEDNNEEEEMPADDSEVRLTENENEGRDDLNLFVIGRPKPNHTGV